MVELLKDAAWFIVMLVGWFVLSRPALWEWTYNNRHILMMAFAIISTITIFAFICFGGH